MIGITRRRVISALSAFQKKIGRNAEGAEVRQIATATKWTAKLRCWNVPDRMTKKSNETSEQPTVLRRPAPGVFVPFLWGSGFVVLSAGLWQIGPIIADGYNVLLPYGFSVVLLLLGLATIWSSIYQLALRRIPATTIVTVHTPSAVSEGPCL